MNCKPLWLEWWIYDSHVSNCQFYSRHSSAPARCRRSHSSSTIFLFFVSACADPCSHCNNNWSELNWELSASAASLHTLTYVQTDDALITIQWMRSTDMWQLAMLVWTPEKYSQCSVRCNDVEFMCQYLITRIWRLFLRSLNRKGRSSLKYTYMHKLQNAIAWLGILWIDFVIFIIKWISLTWFIFNIELMNYPSVQLKCTPMLTWEWDVTSIFFSAHAFDNNSWTMLAFGLIELDMASAWMDYTRKRTNANISINDRSLIFQRRQLQWLLARARAFILNPTVGWRRPTHSSWICWTRIRDADMLI